MSYHSCADMGGEDGHGRVVPDPDVFHADWERRMMGVTIGMLVTGTWNGDRMRSAFETLPDYRARSYYQIWLGGVEKLAQEYGLVGADEIEAGRMLHPPRKVPNVLRAADVAAMFGGGRMPVKRIPAAPARFAAGNEVKTRAAKVDYYTRLPDYARGRRGRIEQVHGVFVFGDAHAQGLGAPLEWLYTVAFTGQELWGDEAAPGLSVAIDAWEPYLEALT